MTDRSRARALARAALAEGAPLRWFEALYREAADGAAVVPWADGVANPHLVAWLDAAGRPAGRALDVGCGYGDNAAALAARGFEVTAFDVSASAVAAAAARFEGAPIDVRVADLLAPPATWRGAFDLVCEVYTLQVLPPALRPVALRALAAFVAPGGALVIVARGRDPGDPAGEMPWPLTRAELDALTDEGLASTSFEDFLDDETPPVRRFRAVWERVG